MTLETQITINLVCDVAFCNHSTVWTGFVEYGLSSKELIDYISGEERDYWHYSKSGRLLCQFHDDGDLP